MLEAPACHTPKTKNPASKCACGVTNTSDPISSGHSSIRANTSSTLTKGYINTVTQSRIIFLFLIAWFNLAFEPLLNNERKLSTFFIGGTNNRIKKYLATSCFCVLFTIAIKFLLICRLATKRQLPPTRLVAY